MDALPSVNTAEPSVPPRNKIGNRLIIAFALAAIGFVAMLFGAGLMLAQQVGARPVIGSPAPDFEMQLYPQYRAGLPETMPISSAFKPEPLRWSIFAPALSSRRMVGRSQLPTANISAVFLFSSSWFTSAP